MFAVPIEEFKKILTNSLSPLELFSLYRTNTIRSAKDFGLGVTGHQVQNYQDVSSAYRLVYQEYFRAGLQNQHSAEMRYAIQQLFPFSHTLIAKHKSQLVGTGTLVFDSVFGLPSGSLYQEELRPFREEGRRIVELTLLSCRKSGRAKANIVAMRLFGGALRVAEKLQVDDFIIVVNPRHVKYWTKKIGFEVISDSKNCTYVQNNPGILLRLNTREVFAKMSKFPSALKICYQTALWGKGQDAELNFLQDQEIYGLLMMRPDLYVNDMTDIQRRYLKALYPLALARFEQETRTIGFTNRSRF